MIDRLIKSRFVSDVLFVLADVGMLIAYFDEIVWAWKEVRKRRDVEIIRIKQEGGGFPIGAICKCGQWEVEAGHNPACELYKEIVDCPECGHPKDGRHFDNCFMKEQNFL